MTHINKLQIGFVQNGDRAGAELASNKSTTDDEPDLPKTPEPEIIPPEPRPTKEPSRTPEITPPEPMPSQEPKRTPEITQPEPTPTQEPNRTPEITPLR